MTVQERLAPGRYRFRIDDYMLLAETGAFGDARTELIEGEVFVMSPQFLPHGLVKAELYDQLRDALRLIGSPLRVLSEVSLEIVPGSMPAPDILLTSDTSGRRAAQVSAVPLLIEVSDTTLADDLDRKLQLYAAAGVPEYWVADVNGRVIHQMWAPAGEAYGEQRQVAFGASVTSTTISGLTIATDRL